MTQGQESTNNQVAIESEPDEEVDTENLEDREEEQLESLEEVDETSNNLKERIKKLREQLQEKDEITESKNNQLDEQIRLLEARLDQIESEQETLESLTDLLKRAEEVVSTLDERESEENVPRIPSSWTDHPQPESDDLEQAKKVEEKEEFDSERKKEKIVEKVNQVFGFSENQGGFIEDFFEDLSQEDLKRVNIVLSSKQRLPGKRDVISALFEKRKEYKGKQEKQNSEQEELEEQVEKIIEKTQDDLVRSGDVKHALQILGMDEVDPEIASNRQAEIVASLVESGQQEGKFSLVKHILKEASKTIRRAEQEQERREEQKEKEAKQQWETLDQEREEAFQKFTEHFQQAENSCEGVTQVIIRDFINKMIPENEEHITIDELESMELSNYKSESASEIAGQEIIRPVFVFNDEKEWENFVTKLGFSENTNGFHKPGKQSGGGEFLDKTGIMFSSGEESTINHEIRHSIDPNIGEREGLNGIIDELFAHYHDIMTEKNENYENRDNPKLAKLNDMIQLIGSEGYYKEYSEQAEEEITIEEYKKLVKKATKLISNLQEEIGDHTEVQRQLAETETLEELFNA